MSKDDIESLQEKLEPSFERLDVVKRFFQIGKFSELNPRLVEKFSKIESQLNLTYNKLELEKLVAEEND